MPQATQICCNPYVSHQDINAKCDDCTCNNCRLVMQKARVIVTEAEGWARKNFEITCYGDHVAFCFWSGSRSHRVVVQINRGEIQVETNITSWTAWLQSLVRRNWSKFAKAVFNILDMATSGFSGVGNFLRGATLKALTFGN